MKFHTHTTTQRCNRLDKTKMSNASLAFRCSNPFPTPAISVVASLVFCQDIVVGYTKKNQRRLKLEFYFAFPFTVLILLRTHIRTRNVPHGEVASFVTHGKALACRARAHYHHERHQPGYPISSLVRIYVYSTLGPWGDFFWSGHHIPTSSTEDTGTHVAFACFRF